MHCPLCGSQRVQIQALAVMEKRGCFTVLLYIFLIVIPFFGWIVLYSLLRGRRSKLVNYAICQSCGYRWKAKKHKFRQEPNPSTSNTAPDAHEALAPPPSKMPESMGPCYREKTHRICRRPGMVASLLIVAGILLTASYVPVLLINGTTFVPTQVDMEDEEPADNIVEVSVEPENIPEETTSSSEPKPEEEAYRITYSKARTWTNSIGTPWVQTIVEIENTSEENLYLDTSAYDLEDENGNLIAAQTMVSVYPNVIAPGEKGYLYDETQLSTNVQSGELKILPRLEIEKAEIDLIRYNVSDISISDTAYLGVKVLGRVENTTNETIDRPIYVVVIFYNLENNPVGIVQNILTDHLNPGDKIGFEISGITLPDDVSTKTIANAVAYAYPVKMQF